MSQWHLSMACIVTDAANCMKNNSLPRVVTW